MFHISAIIGVSLGYFEWFIGKTPLNLLLMFGLLLLIYPLNNSKRLLLTLTFLLAGILVEWLGVNYGLLFGNYSYGQNLGPKIGGVPLIIGVNWALLVWITGAISNRVMLTWPGRMLMGALLMLGLDFLMEVSAPVFDFWEFSGGKAPFSNYVGWFVVALALHGLYQYFKMDGNGRFSLHLFLAQVVFFGYFYAYFTL
jgi:putative membrane protein